MRGGVQLGALAALVAVGLPAWAAPSTGPLTFPETLRGTVRVPLEQGPLGGLAESAKPADTLRDLYPTLAACWEAPRGLSRSAQAEITTRFALRRDGSVLGTPRVTFSAPNSDPRAHRILADATLAAIRRCTPARITPDLGAAIAGRPIALRFIYQGPKGKGV